MADHRDTRVAATACSEALDAAGWVHRFLADLAVARSAQTVRAYQYDLSRWSAFCHVSALDPLRARPRDIVAFIRYERERPARTGAAVGTRTLVRRLSAIRQWYAYLMLEPELTGVPRNPVPGGSALRTASGSVASRPALLRYDRPQPQTLSPDDIARFVAHLTATRHRDRALVWVLKDGGLRISEALALRLGDIHWAGRRVTVRATKMHTARTVALSAEALAALSAYLRLERPPDLAHDHVFVCLGRRSFGQPFGYRAWAAVCEQARRAAGTPRVHAHALRHTCATNLAEAGMPLDTLQRQLGHRHIDTTLIYAEIRDGRLQRDYQQAMATAGLGALPGEEGR